MMDEEVEVWLAKRPKFAIGRLVYVMNGRFVGAMVEILSIHAFQALERLPRIAYFYDVRFPNWATLTFDEDSLSEQPPTAAERGEHGE